MSGLRASCVFATLLSDCVSIETLGLVLVGECRQSGGKISQASRDLLFPNLCSMSFVWGGTILKALQQCLESCLILEKIGRLEDLEVSVDVIKFQRRAGERDPGAARPGPTQCVHGSSHQMLPIVKEESSPEARSGRGGKGLAEGIIRAGRAGWAGIPVWATDEDLEKLHETLGSHLGISPREGQSVRRKEWNSEDYAVKKEVIKEVLLEFEVKDEVLTDIFSTVQNARFKKRLEGDAWQQSWGPPLVCWWNPPFSRLADAVMKIILYDAKGVFIAPDWDSDWLKVLLKIAKKEVMCLSWKERRLVQCAGAFTPCCCSRRKKRFQSR